LFNVYEKLFNACVLQLDSSDEVAMLRGFFSRSSKRFAGLKTIPSFHRQWSEIAALVDIQFITIARRDVMSCIASMLVSESTRQWRLPARQQLGGTKKRFREWFSDRWELEMALGDCLNRLLFDLRSIERLQARPDTIPLCCEDLVETAYESPAVNDYFDQRIPMRGFKRPTDYHECFVDPDEFRDTVMSFLAKVLHHDRFIPMPIRALLSC
jgi:hypothetical protein